MNADSKILSVLYSIRVHRRSSAAINLRSCFAILAFLAASLASAQPQARDIDGLLRQMSLDEKISLLHGARDPKNLGEAGYWPGLPRLGIPPLRLADGPCGVNVNRDATGMPAPVGLAATFNPEAARLYGVVMGRDARALEQDILLAPHVNIVRDPLFRRNHTTLGEDPLLSARLGAAEIAGIQSQGVMAQVKHLAGYNGSNDVIIDERTLREIYLPAFEAAVQAGAASAMCAYNRINGAWACENPALQNGILRGEWGFTGFVTSDWGAVHSTLALAAGLDLEMPGREIAGRPGGPYFGDALQAAVRSGAVAAVAVDSALARILRQLDRFHLLDPKPPARPASIDVEADAKIVRDIAGQSAVLLKNEGGALPIAAADLASLAVIGPTGGQLAAGFLGERAAGFAAPLGGRPAAPRSPGRGFRRPSGGAAGRPAETRAGGQDRLRGGRGPDRRTHPGVRDLLQRKTGIAPPPDHPQHRRHAGGPDARLPRSVGARARHGVRLDGNADRCRGRGLRLRGTGRQRQWRRGNRGHCHRRATRRALRRFRLRRRRRGREEVVQHRSHHRRSR